MPEKSSGAVGRLHGRRVGRPLSGIQRELVDHLLPRLQVPLPARDDIKIDPARLFPDGHAFALEVGFGGGEHLAEQALLHPDWGFIGCEPFVNGVAKLLAQLHARDLNNVRVFPGDARVILGRLPEECLSAVYILFPDPWPKSRHHKRRFICPENLDALAAALKPGGTLRLATDHMDYAFWMMRTMLDDGRFEWTAECAADWRVRPSDWPETRYEQKARLAGRPSAYLQFFRR